MKRLNKKQAFLIFYGFDIFLLLVLLFVLIPLPKKNGSINSTFSLIEKKLINDVAKIQINVPLNSSVSSSIDLKCCGSFWLGWDSFTKSYWPCNDSKIESLISAFVNENKCVKKTSNPNSWRAFGVDNSNAVSVTFFSGSGQILSSVYFGSTDPLTKKINFRTWENSNVWQCESDFSSFLNSNPSFWADVFMVPQSVSGFGISESEQFLRRGEMTDLLPADSIKPVREIKKHFGNGSHAVYLFYKKDEKYIVFPKFSAGPAFSAEENDSIKKINYRYSVSEFTFEKFLSVIGE